MRCYLTHPRLAGLSAAVALALSVGCSAETGLIIEVSASDLAGEPDTLVFFVGAQADQQAFDVPDCGPAIRFTDDASSTERQISVAGRDLTTSPYRLYLSPDSAESMQRDVMVTVVAMQGSTQVGYGRLDGPVSFAADQVRSWPVALSGSTQVDAYLTSAKCLCTDSNAGKLAIVPADDADCDLDVGDFDCDDNNVNVGWSKPEVCGNAIDDNCNAMIDEQVDEDNDGYFTCADDCNDRNPNVYLGAPEICDGFDNDCRQNTERHPDKSECYVENADGACYVGKRYCDDFNWQNGGWQDECQPVGTELHDEASPTLCDEFQICVEDSELYDEAAECADEIFEDVQCTQFVFIDPNSQERYLPCPGAAFLGENLAPGDYCRWVLMGGVEQDGYDVELRGYDGDPIGNDGAVIEACHVRLRVSGIHNGPPEEPPTSEFRIWATADGAPDTHLRVELRAERIPAGIEECPDLGGLSCSSLSPLPPLPAP